jgi:ATP diphosphatase
MTSIDRLLAIMARLRDPDAGCPWDLEQSFATIAPYTVEEAYEVDDAIRRGDLDGLRDELGDLLLQVVFHARMAQEAGHFGFEDVVAAICDKLVRRHPHVFGPSRRTGPGQSVAEQIETWEALKEAERGSRPGTAGDPFADVALGLPALLRAQKLDRRARRAGVVAAPDAAAREEAWRRLETELGAGEAGADALGELLLVLARTANASGVDAEEALRGAAARFEARGRERSGVSPGDPLRPGAPGRVHRARRPGGPPR